MVPYLEMPDFVTTFLLVTYDFQIGGCRNNAIHKQCVQRASHTDPTEHIAYYLTVPEPLEARRETNVPPLPLIPNPLCMKSAYPSHALLLPEKLSKSLYVENISCLGALLVPTAFNHCSLIDFCLISPQYLNEHWLEISLRQMSCCCNDLRYKCKVLSTNEKFRAKNVCQDNSKHLYDFLRTWFPMFWHFSHDQLHKESLEVFTLCGRPSHQSESTLSESWIEQADKISHPWAFKRLAWWQHKETATEQTRDPPDV